MRIWYISPFSVSKNIGYEYNEQIKLLPAEDWICLTDQDVCFLLPFQKRQIEEIVLKDEYELYGCLTNRLAGIHQLYKPEHFDCGDIAVHIEDAKECERNNYGVCEPTNESIAGMFMLFRKSTWERVGGFLENSIQFDKAFSHRVKSKAIMRGVLLFHLYRFNQKFPASKYHHLVPDDPKVNNAENY